MTPSQMKCFQSSLRKLHCGDGLWLSFVCLGVGMLAETSLGGLPFMLAATSLFAEWEKENEKNHK